MQFTIIELTDMALIYKAARENDQQAQTLNKYN